MKPSANNPCPFNSPDHAEWNQWNKTYFAQPISGQLYDSAAQLRGSVTAPIATSAELLPLDGRKKLRIHIYTLEGVANLAQEAAERADEGFDTPIAFLG